MPSSISLHQPPTHRPSCSIVVANGDAPTLDAYVLISRSVVCLRALTPEEHSIPAAPDSALQRAMAHSNVVAVDPSTPDRCRSEEGREEEGWRGVQTAMQVCRPLSSPARHLPACPRSMPRRHALADYQHLCSACGIDWLLAASLTCSDDMGGPPVSGAVLAAGRGAVPGIDARWFCDWANEAAAAIAHASLTVMEVRGRQKEGSSCSSSLGAGAAHATLPLLCTPRPIALPTRCTAPPPSLPDPPSRSPITARQAWSCCRSSFRPACCPR